MYELWDVDTGNLLTTFETWNALLDCLVDLVLTQHDLEALAWGEGFLPPWDT